MSFPKYNHPSLGTFLPPSLLQHQFWSYPPVTSKNSCPHISSLYVQFFLLGPSIHVVPSPLPGTCYTTLRWKQVYCEITRRWYTECDKIRGSDLVTCFIHVYGTVALDCKISLPVCYLFIYLLSYDLSLLSIPLLPHTIALTSSTSPVHVLVVRVPPPLSEGTAYWKLTSKLSSTPSTTVRLPTLPCRVSFRTTRTPEGLVTSQVTPTPTHSSWSPILSFARSKVSRITRQQS